MSEEQNSEDDCEKEPQPPDQGWNVCKYPVDSARKSARAQVSKAGLRTFGVRVLRERSLKRCACVVVSAEAPVLAAGLAEAQHFTHSREPFRGAVNTDANLPIRALCLHHVAAVVDAVRR